MNTSSQTPLALVGICGGIAAYKAVDVVSRLKKAGWDVRVALSEAAQRFVTPLTFAAVSGQPALTSVFPAAEAHERADFYPHLYPALQAELFVLLPATADMMARVAHGFGSDIVSTSALSLRAGCLRVFCPAMNAEMWNQPVVQANAAALEAAGWLRIGPATGLLACGVEGPGRMAEPPEIVEAIQARVARGRRLAGRRIAILSGPTREHLDPVRFLGNASSGRMGRALAEAAAEEGAEVEFITGPVPEANLPARPGVRVTQVVSAEEMLAAAAPAVAAADAAIYAAAVADFRPAVTRAEKRPKDRKPAALALAATPDIAATLGRRRKKGAVAVGFALQTGDGRPQAAAKLQAKGFDAIVLNGPDALGGGSGTYTFLAAGRLDQPEAWGRLAKPECARRIMDFVAQRLRQA